MPDRSPFWSVVIPLYNKGPYIEATVASVLAQSDADFEIVVVDDGSRDDGPDRVAAMSDPRIRLIRQANGGVSAARNRGIAESRGVFVAFLDGDDLHHPLCLETLRHGLEQYPAANLVAGGFERVPHAQMSQHAFAGDFQSIQFSKIDNLPKEFLLRGLPFFTSSVVVRRSLLLEMPEPFPVGESLGEDLDLWFRIAERSPVIVTDCKVAVYRVEVEGSLMSTKKDVELLPFLLRMEQRACGGLIATSLRSHSLLLVAYARVTLARARLKYGDRIESFGLLVKAKRCAGSKRWWLTLIAVVGFPKCLIRRIF